MRDQLHKALKPIKDKSGLWWLFFWKWPALLRECHGELDHLTSDLSMVREKFRAEQSRCEAFEKLANESREMASASASRASAEKTLSQNLSEELGNAKVQLQKSSETVGSLENKIARMEMETERVKAELAKTQADLTRSGLELEREKRIQQDARRDVTLLRELVHRMHRLDIPTRRGIKAMLSNGSRLIAFLALLLPMVLLSAPFPPPFFRGVYTTNTAAWANTNVISLSTTNATSKPLTNHYQDGVLTLFGLEAGANTTITPNGSNLVISTTASGGLTTNANQIGASVELTIKNGAFLTNMNYFGTGTNDGDLWIDGNFLPITGDAYSLGTLTVPWGILWLHNGGLQLLDDDKSDVINIVAPSSVTSYGLLLPDAQGANGTTITNDGTGTLGWWDAPAVIAQKQFGTASLTNLAGNPNVATNILGAGTVTVTSNNLGTWTITGAAGSGSSVFTQGVSVVTVATNINFVNGSNVAITAVNASGNVTLTVHSPTDFTNIYYVNKDSNLSSILTNAPNNSKIWIGAGNWTNRESFIFAGLGDLGYFHLLNKTNIEIEAVGKATIWNTGQGDGLVLSNCMDITTKNLRFFGANQTNANSTNLHGTIVLANCKNINLLDGRMDNSSDHMIVEFFPGVSFQSTNVVIEGWTFFNCGSWYTNGTPDYDGALVPGSHWTIRRNHFQECVRGVEFYGAELAPVVCCTVVEDNYFDNIIQYAVFDGGATNNYYHSFINNRIIYNNAFRTVSSNTLASAAIFLNYSRGLRLERNFITGVITPSLFGNSAILIQGGSQAYESFDVNIIGNIITNCETGIIFNESATAKFRSFQVLDNQLTRIYYDPIRVSGTSFLVERNNIKDSQVNGSSSRGHIWIGPTAFGQQATNVTVVNNMISVTPGFVPTSPGIFIDSSAVECRVSENDISSSYSPKIVDNGIRSKPYVTIGMITGISTNPFVLLNTNDAPVFSIDNRGFLIITNGLTNRVASPTNTIAFGAENFGGFNLPNWTDHNGLQASLQPFFAHEHIYWLSTYNGTQIGGQGVAPVTNVGTTVSHPLPVESQPHSVQLASVTTSNGCATAFSAVDLANVGAHNGSSKIGGYFFAATWYSTNLISGVVGGGAPRHFVGLTARATADYTNMVVTTNATGQYVGLYADPHQSLNMYISARDSVAEFRTNTGINFVATNVYKFYMFNAPTSRFVGWRLDDAYAGVTASGWFSNNVPTNFMKFGIATKNGTNRANDVRFCRMYLQAPLAPPR